MSKKRKNYNNNIIRFRVSEPYRKLLELEEGRRSDYIRLSLRITNFLFTPDLLDAVSMYIDRNGIDGFIKKQLENQNQVINNDKEKDDRKST